MAELFADDAVLCQVPEALSRRLIDGVLVLAPAMTEPLRVSGPGGAIWSLLAQPSTIAELVEALSTHYGAAVETVRVEIQPVLRALHDGGAVTVT